MTAGPGNTAQGGLRAFPGDRVGLLLRPIEASKAAVCYAGNTSGPADRSSQARRTLVQHKDVMLLILSQISNRSTSSRLT